MSEFIPLSVPNLKGNELKYVTEAIESEWVSTGGSFITTFEEQIASYTKAKGAVACQSGTAGLHLALLGAGVKSGDEVIVPTLTFIAAVNPVTYIGAEPIFMDCDKDFCMDAAKLKRFLEEECEYTKDRLINRKTNKRIAALIVVHVFGNLADMESIMALARQYNLKVIEDATEALGSYFTEGDYKGKYAGTIGDFGVYSFNGNKIITTGGGGVLVAQDEADLKMAKYLSTQAKDDELDFIHHHIGYNYRMTNVQAAIGLAQLEQLEAFIAHKKENYAYYEELLKEVEGVTLLGFKENIRANYWFYPLQLDLQKIGLSVSEVIKCLGEEKIQTRPIWELIHRQTPYRAKQAYDITQAIIYRDTIINIPCSSNLSKEQVRRVVKSLECICKGGK